MPVGFKNGTDGNIKIAIDAIGAAQGAHAFLSVTKQGVSAIVTTAGNDACHIILRGGASGPNYDQDSISEVEYCLKEQDLPPLLQIDCSHGNSRKDFRNQPLVARDLCHQIEHGSRAIASVMIESNLVEGNQKLGSDPAALVYGQSITDACISWQTTEEVLEGFAQAVRKRRG